MANQGYVFKEKRPMGIGLLLSGNTTLLRKYRWTLGVDFVGASSYQSSFQGRGGCLADAVEGGCIPEHYVKSASRPKLEIEELELNFLNQKFWVPGKGAWQTVEVTYYDVATQDIGLTGLWTWIDSIYQIMDRSPSGGESTGYAIIDRYQASMPKDYLGWTDITMYDGCGNWMQNWSLQDSWPQNIDWGELDMSSNDEANIVITLRYSQASVKFNTNCNRSPNPGCCSSCNEQASSAYDYTVV